MEVHREREREIDRETDRETDRAALVIDGDLGRSKVLRESLPPHNGPDTDIFIQTGLQGPFTRSDLLENE